MSALPIWPEQTGEITADDNALDHGDIADGLALRPSTDNARGEDWFDDDLEEEEEEDEFDGE